MTQFLLRSMVISRTGTIQISTLRHKKSTESAILFVRFHIRCLILTGSSSADKALNFCMTKSNLLDIIVHLLILGKMLAASRNVRCCSPAMNYATATKQYIRVLFSIFKTGAQTACFIFLDNSRPLVESETNLDKDRVLVLRTRQQSIKLITELPLK